jgi:hypothetical protein
MNSLVVEAAAASHWRLGAWAGRAWRHMGWRHLALALVLYVVGLVFGPLGGIIFSILAEELIERLDPAVFWQVHRGVIVNVNAVKSVRRAPAGHLELRLKQRTETLRVSAANAHLFKHM